MEQSKGQNKVWGKSDIQSLIESNEKAVYRALVLIYSKQTEAEKAIDQTKDHNGVGFSGLDAEILSSFAKFYQRAGFLTTKQVAIAKKKLKKYWRQILNDMKERGYQVAFK